MTMKIIINNKQYNIYVPDQFPGYESYGSQNLLSLLNVQVSSLLDLEEPIIICREQD